MNRKLFFLFILISLSLLLTTCRKVSKHKPELVGEWIARPQESICDWFYLNISESSRGSYGTAGGHGCGWNNKGKARFDNNHLYIGMVKFKVLQWPIATSDSVTSVYTHSKVKALSKMTVRNSALHGKITIDFYKIK